MSLYDGLLEAAGRREQHVSSQLKRTSESTLISSKMSGHPFCFHRRAITRRLIWIALHQYFSSAHLRYDCSFSNASLARERIRPSSLPALVGMKSALGDSDYSMARTLPCTSFPRPFRTRSHKTFSFPCACPATCHALARAIPRAAGAPTPPASARMFSRGESRSRSHSTCPIVIAPLALAYGPSVLFSANLKS